LDVSYGQDEVDQGPLVAASVKTTGLADSRNASSRLGFRGVEDLGGGMEAGFVLEAGLNITGGASFNKTTGQTSNAQTGALTQTQADNAVFGAATRQAFLTLGKKRYGYFAYWVQKNYLKAISTTPLFWVLRILTVLKPKKLNVLVAEI